MLTALVTRQLHILSLAFQSNLYPVLTFKFFFFNFKFFVRTGEMTMSSSFAKIVFITVCLNIGYEKKTNYLKRALFRACVSSF